MRTKLKAEFVIDQAKDWLDRRQKRINKLYENKVEKAMARSISNLFLGRSRQKAIKFLDNWKSGCFHNNHKEYLEFNGSYWTWQVEDALKLATLSLESGNGDVWLTKDELFFIKDC